MQPNATQSLLSLHIFSGMKKQRINNNKYYCELHCVCVVFFIDHHMYRVTMNKSKAVFFSLWWKRTTRNLSVHVPYRILRFSNTPLSCTSAMILARGCAIWEKCNTTETLGQNEGLVPERGGCFCCLSMFYVWKFRHRSQNPVLMPYIVGPSAGELFKP